MTTIKSLLLTIPLLPFLELAAFFAVAAQIGLGWAVLFLLATSFAGAVVLRNALGRHFLPVADTLATYNGSRGLVLLGGFLLLIPGFITDVAGILLLLIPLWRFLTARQKNRLDGVVDLEPEQWRHVPDPKLPPDSNAGRQRRHL